MPESIPRGLTREHVLLALAELDIGLAHPFGAPTKYELIYEGRRYAPKAVVGLAHRHLAGAVLPPNRFSGGEAPGQANYVLRRLGFAVVQKEEAVPEEDADKRRPWSEQEAALAVADYFAMLRKELLGDPYVKTEHNAALRQAITRSTTSVEYKHQNISAVLLGLGLPYISGYKPASNYQKILVPTVEAFLAAQPDYLEGLAGAHGLDPQTGAPLPAGDPAEVFVDPPEQVPLPAPGKPWATRIGRRTDFARRDAENRRLGRRGEEFVVELERARLRSRGRDDLARRVDWVASTVGDGLGFDILSFDAVDDSEQFVEVKTTGLGKYHPFYVSATEVRCSQDVPEKFQLYRVFDFAREPRVFILPGSLREVCHLEPTEYLAGPQ